MNMQQRAPGQESNPESVHGTPTLSTELIGAPQSTVMMWKKKSLEFLTNLAGMLSNDGFIKKSPMNIYVCILTGFFNPKMSAHI